MVRQTVAELRPRMKPVYQSLQFYHGECAQVDWGVWRKIDVPGGQRKISFFCMVLCHSRMLYVEFFMGEQTEHWLQAHRNAFEYFGGVPQSVMVDNCKTAVIKPRSCTGRDKCLQRRCRFRFTQVGPACLYRSTKVAYYRRNLCL